MRVREIVEHFLSRATWIDHTKTVDKVIIGDPDADADRCLVTWMPNMRALEAAVERSFSLVICHEPTFWNHRDVIDESDGEARAKRQFISENGITIVRNHDCWDRWPNVGIPWAWAQFLGLGDKPAATGREGYLHCYDVSPVTLSTFARGVASACSPIGEPAVQVTGDLDRLISRVGVGTGCACDVDIFRDMGCDCSIVCDDGSCYWSVIQRAEDMGHPVIRVNHGTSEEPGMVTLTNYINDCVAGVSAEHFPHGSTFRLVGADIAPDVK
ncbi:MAG: hypothetical protein HN742_28940 [Lentisphaerae bacterium]|jgi:putative NIF3 family GTP cyclohydrolase 1 type 2|nr:hypothetical protein [Lentisphaerota bacterium]MBT4821365.1 hypothetical protein [Lentisphaerota bacterium]MBT5609518.1 hypothetical protein [Lentisphaerota bacterium]MBT7058484.1 hypothetical protein [Lentisphaerota bacterium]MBT7845934.1 hypothetical protein [Lentisphaerota bacterium]